MTALSLPAPRRRPKTYAKSEATLRASSGASSGSGGSVTGTGPSPPRWCASMRSSTKASSVASSSVSDCPPPSAVHKDEDEDEDEERLAVKEGEEPLRLRNYEKKRRNLENWARVKQFAGRDVRRSRRTAPGRRARTA